VVRAASRLIFLAQNGGPPAKDGTVIVVDTNVISELVRERSEPAVVAWMDALPATSLYTTSITEAEMLFGLAIMPSGPRRERLRRGIDTIFSALFMGRVLPFDRNAARAYADLAADRRKVGRSFNGADLQIAAIARARAATAIATRNTRDFEDCGVALVNPWEA
jgi:toxin FitB